MNPDAVASREDLGRALTDLRLSAGLSVRDVATEADGLVGTIAGWFAGQHAPTRASREMFERVLAACGVAPDDYPQWWEAVGRTSRRGGRRRSRPAAPYPGFDAFGPDDREYFFGRDDLVQRLVELVLGSHRRSTDDSTGAELLGRSVMVVGPSGVGKSSLVRAGLLPETAAAGRLAGWTSTVLVPGDDAVAALEEALARLADSAGADGGPALLVMDQLEELWTQNGEPARRRFGSLLQEYLAGHPVVPVGVLRADFYSLAIASPGWSESFSAAQVVVPQLTADQLREVIVRPAETVGVTVDDELVQLLLDDTIPAGGGRVTTSALPLLSHALRTTWDVSDGRRLTVGDYLKTGRIGGAVEQTAEQACDALTADEQQVAQRVLLTLVNVDEDTVTRRTVRLGELGLDPDDPEFWQTPAGRVLGEFADARLLTVTDSDVQVTHEALLTAWPRLTGWIDADRERLLLQRRLRTLSEPWEADGRPDDLLPGRARLEMFRPLLDDGPDSVDVASAEFLAAARRRVDEQDAAEGARARKLRRFAVVSTVFGAVAVLAAVAAVVAGVAASHQRDSAERARNEALSRQLAVQSNQLSARSPALAAELAVVAYQQAPTVEARSTLIDTLSGSMPVRFTGDGSALKLSQAGSLLAVAGGVSPVRLFAVGTQGVERELATFSVEEQLGQVGGVALLPDAQTLVLAGAGFVELWDVRDPAHPVRSTALPGVRGTVNAIAVSPDGQLIATTAEAQGLQVWRTGDDGWQPMPLDASPGELSGGIAISPDGVMLASATESGDIQQWRIASDALHAEAAIPLGGPDNQLANALVYTSDGDRLYAGLRSRVLAAFDVADPAAPQRLPDIGEFESYVMSVDLDDTERLVVGAASDNTVRVFDLDEPGGQPRVLPISATSSSVVFSGDHVLVGLGDGQLLDWADDSSEVVIGAKSVFQIPASNGGERVVAADSGRSGQLTQWRREGSLLVRDGADLLPPPDETFSGAVVLTPDGRTATLGTVSGTVYFADLSDPEHPRITGQVAAQNRLNETVDYSPVSGLAVTGGTDLSALTVIDARAGGAPQAVATFDAGSGVWWASLSPDGRYAAAATNNGRVRLIDLQDPTRPVALPDPIAFRDGTAMAVRFSADGRRLVATSEGGTVQVADIADPQHPEQVAEMHGPAGQLYSASFSPDGTKVAASGGNSEVWVWSLDGRRAREYAVLRSYPGIVYDVRFADDQTLLAAGAAGYIKSWRLDPTELIGDLCARLGDRLTADEWALYAPGVDYRPPCD